MSSSVNISGGSVEETTPQSSTIESDNIHQGTSADDSYVAHSDEMLSYNMDLLEGYSYSPPLLLTTPLEALKNYGKLHTGSIRNAPRHCDGDAWVPKMKKQFETPLEPSVPSDIGMVNPNDYLPHLMRFREIVKMKATPLEKLAHLEKQTKADKDFAKYWSLWEKVKGQNFAHGYIGIPSAKVDDLPGVGKKTVEKLKARNLYTVKDLSSISPEEFEQMTELASKLAQKAYEEAKSRYQTLKEVNVLS